MTAITITASFGSDTFTRRTEAGYTHASRKGSTVRFHTSEAAARRAAGASGSVVRTSYVPDAVEATFAATWIVTDADGNEGGRYTVDNPVHAIKAAREEGKNPTGARRVQA